MEQNRKRFNLGDINRKMNGGVKPAPLPEPSGAVDGQVPAKPSVPRLVMQPAPEEQSPYTPPEKSRSRQNADNNAAMPASQQNPAHSGGQSAAHSATQAHAQSPAAPTQQNMQPGQNIEEREEEFDLFRYLSVLIRRKAVVAFITVGFACFSLFSYLTAPKYFMATARLLFRPDQQVIGQDRTSFLYDRSKTFNTHLEMLKSRIVLERISQNFDNSITWEQISENFTISQGLTAGEKTDIIELTYKNSDATMARDLLNDLCRTYIEYHREVNSQEDTRLIMNLMTQIDKLQTDLSQKEDALRVFKEQNGVVQLSSESNIVVTKLTTMEVELQQTQLALLSAKEQISALNSQIDHQDMNVVQSMTYENPYQEKISQLELELTTISAEYGNDHFKVRNTSQQIETLKKAMQTEISREAVSKTLIKNPIREGLLEQLVSLNIEIASLEAKRTAQEQFIEKLNAEIQNLPQKEQTYASLQRETDSRLNTLSMLKQKYEEAKIERDSKESDIKILELAGLPEDPISSKRVSSVFMGLLVGLILGIAFAFLLEYLDQTLKDISQVEKVLELPLLGLVPSIDIDFTDVSDKGKNKAANSMLEPFRALRANLKHLIQVHNARILMICSAVKGEGKTTLSVNLALTFALDGKKVILVDGDLRRSQIHHFLDVPKQIGVNDYLNGSRQITEVIKATKHKNLFVITSGERPNNPAEVLGTVRLDQMIDELRSQADIIIFDSPALLPVSDTLIMAPKMDACVMVVRTLWTPIRAARFAREQLRRIGSKMIGAIINGVPQAKGYYPYYYGYYGYYSYRYSYDEEPRRPLSIRQFGLAIENWTKEFFGGLSASVPRYVASASRLFWHISRRRWFWILLAVLVGLTGVRLYFGHRLPDPSGNNSFFNFIGKGNAVENEPIAVVQDTAADSQVADITEYSVSDTSAVNDSSDSFADNVSRKTLFPAKEIIAGWVEAVNSRDSIVYSLMYDSAMFSFAGGGYMEWIKQNTSAWLKDSAAQSITRIDTVLSAGVNDTLFSTQAGLTIKDGGRQLKMEKTMMWRYSRGQWKIIREKEQVLQ